MKSKPTITFKSTITNGNQIKAIRVRETVPAFVYACIMYLLIELINKVCVQRNMWVD